MIEIISKTHVQRLFATKTQFSDLFKAVVYFGFKGRVDDIPFYFSKHKGESCETDLTLSIEEIMGLMKSNTRNEVRRAEKENCTFEIENDIDAFVKFYNDFCDSKGLNDYTNRARLTKYQEVLITKCIHDGQVVAMHANILDRNSKVALLLFSCSQRFDAGIDKKLIGWGNRYLHFKDMEYLKNQGFTKYDWSGTCSDPEDERYTISQFKLSFGGTPVDSWTLRSPIFVAMEKIRDLVVRFRK